MAYWVIYINNHCLIDYTRKNNFFNLKFNMSQVNYLF